MIEQSLKSIHKLICEATFPIVMMIVKKKFKRRWALAALPKLEEAVLQLRVLLDSSQKTNH